VGRKYFLRSILIDSYLDLDDLDTIKYIGKSKSINMGRRK
jgi:hypothetical protein